MKRVSIFLAATICLSFIFISCKKSSDAAPADPGYVGLWKGKYGNGATTYPTLGYAFLFRNDGTVRVFNDTDTSIATKAEGTYSITGAAVTATYKYISNSSQYSVAATIDPKFTFQEGTWGTGTNTTNGGKYFIVKQ
jgi:hypothetical protein